MSWNIQNKYGGFYSNKLSKNGFKTAASSGTGRGISIGSFPIDD